MRNIIVIFLLNIIIIILIFLSGCDNSVNTTTSSTVETSTTINPNSDITFKVTVPINTPVTDNIYITGDFENWTGGMAGYKLTKNSDGTYEIKIKKPETKDAISFKFTRGSWESVEGNISGSAIANRSYTFTIVDDVKELSILSWTDLPPVGVADSFSFVKMTIPQLDDRVRTIRVYLPPDYKTAPDKRYPVIYMHDAQNIYAYSDKELSGKWNVDVALNKLFADKKIDGVIVVGIDNGTNRRGEYCPWVFDYKVGNAIGNGEGVKFAEFIVKMLKPKIDADYRTLADRENTAMIGSSTGAVITMYCGIKYQDIFSKVACLSANFIDGVNGV
ncbi:MAG TPA: alpha/beta hydrolase-fold protein, partial [Spirochaetota bacterium]|nr:alpha/beta hydrolase-fold protein [Spirochaetota bacterium]